MKTDYNERRENRITRAKELAEKNERAQGDLFAQAHALGSVIPMGQPILIGHHSEKRHRRHLEKIDNKMRQGVEAGNKAKYYEEKAAAMEANTAISSDDSQALEKLKAKLASLESRQEIMKAANKVIKGKGTDAEKVEKLISVGIPEKYATGLLTPDYCNRLGFPSYKLTNNNANMKRIKDRITHLERVQSMPAEEIEINGVRMVSNVEGNRLQLFFPGKPAEWVRDDLKRAGFHWSPREGAWQRFLSIQAKWQGERILRTIWNREIIDEVARLLECTNGDAQGVFEAAGELVSAHWMSGSTAQETAEAIKNK